MSFVPLVDRPHVLEAMGFREDVDAIQPSFKYMNLELCQSMILPEGCVSFYSSLRRYASNS